MYKGLTQYLILSLLVIIPINHNADMPHKSQRQVNIIPLPQKTIFREGNFVIDDNTTLIFDSGLVELKPAVTRLINFIFNTGIRLKVSQPDDPEIHHNIISLVLTDLPDQSFGTEWYNLLVDTENITIKASSTAGLFYGLQSLRSLLDAEINSDQLGSKSHLKIQCVEISDYPKFKWRGLMLDCCRHFVSKDFIKRYIDLLSLYKMNRLHLHLTEDQGWRLEIKKYPQLTKTGAWRKTPEGNLYGGYYTHEDITEIVKYAAENFITIVPEIEIPGHCTAALSVFPELSCSRGPFEVGTQWGIYKDVFCAGNDSVYTFLENVFSEVTELFPGEFIHIGGDEVPKDRWKNCLKCQEKIKLENLQNEEALQSYFINRITAFLMSKNKKVIGWDEVIEGGLNPNIIVQSWRGLEGTYQAVKLGNHAISSHTSYAYFDYDIETTNLEEVYFANPIPENLSSDESELILGGECNIWTEYAPQEKIDSKVFPRILAMAEVLWTYPSERNFEEFFKRVYNHYRSLKALGVDYGPEVRTIKAESLIEYGSNLISILIKSSDPVYNIFFTTDGTIPNSKSEIYKNPIKISSTCNLKAQAYWNELPFGEMIDIKVNKHLGTGIAPLLKFPYSDKYSAGGDFALTNGLTGSTRYNDGNWQGFLYNDFEAIIELKSAKEIDLISINFLRDISRWIFLPENVSFHYSEDGINYNIIHVVATQVSNSDPEPIVVKYETKGLKLNARYIKVFAKNIGICPPWHIGSGGNAWLFTDEIIIN